MALSVYMDRVKETSTTTGTGTLTLAGAVAGFRTFASALTTGAIVTYCIEDGTNWEVGQGAYTTSGTTLARTTIYASSNAGAAVNWTAGTRNVFLTVSARELVPLSGVLYGQSGTAGCLAATADRWQAQASFTAGAAVSGTLRLHGIILPAGLPVTSIAFVSGTTAGVALTHQWFGLFDSARVVLAKTADDTSTAWGATTKKTLTITGGPFVTTYSGLHYIGILITAGTLPTIECQNQVQNTGARNAAPLADGNSTTGLTDPASCTGTQTALTLIAQHAYAEIF